MAESRQREEGRREAAGSPCAPSDPPASPAPGVGIPEGRPILLAEDQPAIQILMSEFLRQGGFHVLRAGDGREALELARSYQGQIDLLLSDVMMPGMDGLALALALKSTRPELKTLLMSGNPERMLPAVGESGVKAGFLQKPFGLPRLLEKVREMTAPAGPVAEQGSGCRPSTSAEDQSIEADV